MKCSTCGYTNRHITSSKSASCPVCTKPDGIKPYQAGNYRIPPEKAPFREKAGIQKKWVVTAGILLLLINTKTLINYFANSAMSTDYGFEVDMSRAAQYCHDINLIHSEEKELPPVINDYEKLKKVHIKTRSGSIFGKSQYYLTDINGKEFQSRTLWLVEWQYDDINKNNLCYINKLRAEANIFTYLPVLVEDKTYKLEEIKWFETYLEELIATQSLEKQNVALGAERIITNLRNLAPSTNCLDLNVAAKNSVTADLKKIKIANKDTSNHYLVKDFKESTFGWIDI